MNLPKITVNVDELIGVNKYNVDDENAHIKLDSEDVNAVDDGEFAKLVRVCPAHCYKVDEDGNKTFDYNGCLECGTCRICCGDTIIAQWKMPEPTMGVQYRFG